MVEKKITNKMVWEVIDELAAIHGLTPSGLSRLCNFDPTTLNPSKRLNPLKRYRAPSLGTVLAICDNLEVSFSDFAIMVEKKADNNGK